MPEKRKRDASDRGNDGFQDRKKQKRGFVVGPDNLPDGTYRRKTQKIKNSLIQKAKIKKDYPKLKRQGKIADHSNEGIPKSAFQKPEGSEISQHEVETRGENNTPPETTISPHPDRQARINNKPASQSPEPSDKQPSQHDRRKKKPKPRPFEKEYSKAQKRKQEAEDRRKAREEAERQRQQKVEERERFRKAMAKARTGGKNGQRKLGRESLPLLERVKRMVNESS